MQKAAFIVFSLFTILMLAFVVSAVGRTTRGDVSVRSGTTIAIDCQTKTELRERILCRFEARKSLQGTQRDAEDDKILEESCRNLRGENKSACNELQRTARPCYEKSGVEKALCLRRHVGLGEGQINRLANFTVEARRQYAALLLYELQERVEVMQEKGKITDAEAASLVAHIVDIKEALLSGASVADIRAKMAAFKTEWRASVSTRAEVQDE